jgi:hypothetical protein
MRPHPRRTQTDTNHPRAWATDDKSGFIGNQVDLQWQYDWAGTQLINKRILCFADQLDVPNRQLGSIILPPDPVSIPNARIEPYPIDEVWVRMYEANTTDPSGVGDALPKYLEGTTMSAAYPVPNTQQPSRARALETSTIYMQAATS